MARILSDNEFADVAQLFKWTYAKTMPQCPHEYIVRGRTADDETYFAMFQTIEDRGVIGTWENTENKYLRPGDGYRYWKMTDIIQESIIINRAKDD